MDWSQGYTSTWRLYYVDQSTWGDGDEIQNINSISVTKDADSDLIEDANISLDSDIPIKGYVRIVLEAKNTTGASRSAIGTFLVTSPKRSIDISLTTRDLECYSVLKPASDKLMPIGWYFPEGGDPIAGACDLLQQALKCPVVMVESGLKTENIKVAENNETYLSMALYLLYDTGWYIHISPLGEVTIKEKTDEIVTTFDTYDNDVITTDTISDESDIFDIPNILRVTDGQGNYEVIKNEDEQSETSLENLGWEKWASESITLDGEKTLLGEGIERMEELSKSKRKITYKREYDPNVNVNDVALYLLPQQGIIGTFRIISQSIEAGDGALISEVAEFESENWRS